MKLKIFFIFLSFFLFAENENELINRIDNHFLLEDYNAALQEAKCANLIFPSSEKLLKFLIIAHAKQGDDITALKLFLDSKLDLKDNLSLIEEISWSVLQRGLNSTQYATRLSSMIGIFFTRDAKVVSILKNMMDDSNAILRACAVQLASHYLDDALKSKILSLLKTEKVWLVKMELLRAVGLMRIKEETDFLKEILKNNKATFEERAIAIEALVKIYDDVDLKELELLLHSSYAGFRLLGLELAAHFKVVKVTDEIIDLAFDSRYDVRIYALNSILLFYKDHIDKEMIDEILTNGLEDSNPFVSITASWVSLVLNPSIGSKNFQRWIFDKYAENRRFAAAALCQSGNYGVSLAKDLIAKTDDPYVKANLAIGLIGQRQNLKLASDTIYDFLKNKKEMWMWESSKNPLFKIICPTQIRHTDQLPNYPEAIDQVVQLNLLSKMAIIEDPRAIDSLKSFLQRKNWGISGMAAITLLQEGDEESLKLLKTLLKDEDQYIRIQAALALALIGKDKTVLPILEEAYYHVDHEMKLNIVNAIGSISSDRSYPFLIKVLQEPFQNLKISAASAIIQAINN